MLWIDVALWSGWNGRYSALTEVECELPEPPPATVAAWQQWATAELTLLALQESWQPGRYSYEVQRRNDAGRTVQLLSRGLWQLVPAQ